VFTLTTSSDSDIQRLISKQKDSGFSYPEVGAAATIAPTGYNVDHNRVQLGRGEGTWRRAAKAIRT